MDAFLQTEEEKHNRNKIVTEYRRDDFMTLIVFLYNIVFYVFPNFLIFSPLHIAITSEVTK
jgi:hypothetical protein